MTVRVTDTDGHFRRSKFAGEISGEDAGNLLIIPIAGAESGFHPHAAQQGVVDIEALGFEIGDLTGLESPIGARNGMEHT